MEEGLIMETWPSVTDKRSTNSHIWVGNPKRVDAVGDHQQGDPRGESGFAGATKEFGSGEVVKLAGVAARQLQWWDEHKVVSPRHEGHKRVYTQQEALEVVTIAELRRKGLSLRAIRPALRFLQREMGKRMEAILYAESSVHMVTDGHSIFFADQARGIIDILKKARRPMFLVAVSEHARRIGCVSTTTA
jgi:DNA-binding transcriptional MerR regulator